MSNLANQLTPEAVQNNLQSLLQTTDSLLDQFQAMHLSLTALTVGAFLCLLVLVIATREAVGWFSKADSIRRELKRLQKTSTEIKTEVKAIKDLLIQLQGPIRTRLETNVTSTGDSTPTSSNGATGEATGETTGDTSGATSVNSSARAIRGPADDAKASPTDSLEREISRKKVFKPSREDEDNHGNKQFPIVH